MRHRLKRRTDTSATDDVKAALEVLTRLKGAVGEVLGAIDTILEAAVEALEYRQVLANNHQPLAYDDLLRRVESSDNEAVRGVHGALKRLEVSVFRLGTLRGYAVDGYDWAAIQFVRSQLEEFLREQYRVTFRVFVNHKLPS